MLETFGLHSSVVWWTILAGVVCNSLCAILGCFLVLKRMSLLGDAVAHAVLPGLAVVFLLTGSVSGPIMLLGGLVAGLLTAVLTQSLTKVGNVPEDSSLGVVFTAMFALGVVLIANVRFAHIDADCILFGVIETAAIHTIDVAGIGIPRTVVIGGSVLLLSLAFIGLLWKELKVTTFDPQLATAMGFSAGVMHYVLMGFVSAATVASLEAVGAILVVAMLIVPAATAHLLTDRLWLMIVLSVVVASLSSFLGAAIDFALETRAAAMMVVVAGCLFTLALFFSPRHGLVAKGWNKFKLSLRIAAEDVVALLYRLEERHSARAATSKDVQSLLTTRMAGFAVPLLKRRGMIAATAAGELQLTIAGRERARSLVRSHRLWEAYLEKHFDLPADHLHEPAEQIEHFIGPELQSRLAESLDNPDADPHGRDIPEEKPKPQESD